MDELNAMRSFAQVVDCGSFVKASRALDVAPSKITRAVADLERHLGARLLNRTTRRTVLTEIGERYLERVRTILRDTDEATALARQSHAQPRGRLRVLAPTVFAAQQLAPRLAHFGAVLPQLTLEVGTASSVDTLDPAHDITIVVCEAPLKGDFVARRLACAHLVACAAPAYLARHGRPARPEDLAAHRLLAAPLQRSLHAQAMGAATAAGDPGVGVVPARAPVHVTNEELRHAGALAGAGIAALPSFAVEPALREGRLERLLPGWHFGRLTLWAAMPTRRFMPAGTRAFLDLLIAEFGGDRHDPWLAAPPAPLRLCVAA